MEREDEYRSGEDFDLDSILAEFSTGGGRKAPASPAEEEEEPKAPQKGAAEKGTAEEGKGVPPHRERTAPPPEKKGPPVPPPEEPNWEEDTIPRHPKKKKKAPVEDAGEKRTGVVTAFPTGEVLRDKQSESPASGSAQPEKAPKKENAPESDRPAPQKKERPTPAEKQPAREVRESPGEVLEFPGTEEEEEENPLTAGLEKLRKKADHFASQMYASEGEEESATVLAAEALIPGVDEEEQPAPVRKRRRELPRAPDTPPAELAKRYGRGLKASGVRAALVLLLDVALWYLTLAGSGGTLPLPAILEGELALRCYLMAGLQAAALLLGADSVLRGLTRPFRLRSSLETTAVLGNLFVLADTLTLPLLGGGTGRQPLSAAAVLVLWCDLLGEVQKRKGQRLACRTAAAVSAPYLVTRDSGKWNGRDTYEKWSGPLTGFGSQVQALDGAERIYGIWTPVVLVACVCFALIASLGRKRPEDLLWALGAIFLAASSLSTTLCFGMPWKKLSTRLAKSGAALAGWEGAENTTGRSNLVLCDHDLFAPGTVKLNGIKVFGTVSIEKVVAVTATLIRDSGSGLDKVFHDLLRSQGAIYRRGDGLSVYEGGGLSENIRGEQVLVGSAAFMTLMNVSLPQGMNVKNAVFCAINGELAGIFALKYTLSGAVPPAIDSLIQNGITPVLATRDFNLIPAMLRQRFKLPVEKMEFPPVERRRELSAGEQEHSDTLTAVLCREGVSPYAEAVVGAKRLRSSVRLSAVLSCVGSGVGALLAFYLTFVAAYASLTPVNLAIFLLMWLVPTPLITGWVDRY